MARPHPRLLILMPRRLLRWLVLFHTAASLPCCVLTDLCESDKRAKTMPRRGGDPGGLWEAKGLLAGHQASPMRYHASSPLKMISSCLILRTLEPESAYPIYESSMVGKMHGIRLQRDTGMYGSGGGVDTLGAVIRGAGRRGAACGTLFMRVVRRRIGSTRTNALYHRV
jgi:hypothetical protein